MKKIAIIGATGYIGRSIVQELLSGKVSFELFLFSRSEAKLKSSVSNLPIRGRVTLGGLSTFDTKKYDVIINCSGVGDPGVLKKDPAYVFAVTEEMDNLILGYLEKNKKTLYINLSSGAVYGNNVQAPVAEGTSSVVTMKHLSPYEYYAIAKINSEAKHRSLKTYNIVDIRIFSFFSSLLDVDSSFLMSEITGSLRDKKVFITNEEDIIRDYITPKDLVTFLRLVIKKHSLNDFFDIYSKAPVSKLKLISSLKKKFGLEYVVTKRTNSKGAVSSSKKAYYPKSKKAEKVLGYAPTFTSLEGIEFELQKMNLK